MTTETTIKRGGNTYTTQDCAPNSTYTVFASGAAHGFTSFFTAVNYARTHGASVFITANGRRCWYDAPATPVSAKRMRAYEMRKAAYEAQQRRNAARRAERLAR